MPLLFQAILNKGILNFVRTKGLGRFSHHQSLGFKKRGYEEWTAGSRIYIGNKVTLILLSLYSLLYLP